MRRLGPSILLLLLLTSACRPSPGPTPEGPDLWRGTVPIGWILGEPERFEGEDVVLLAYWRGWDLLDEVPGGPPKSRSDVVVADPTGALYVVSAPGAPAWEGVPADLAPDRLGPPNLLLRLEGRVRFGPWGPYLEVRRGRAVEGLPWGTVLRIDRSGTILGLNQSLWALEDGRMYVVDRKGGWAVRFTGPETSVREVLEAIHALPAPGTPVPDQLLYTFHTWRDDQVQVQTYPDDPEALGTLRERLEGWFAYAEQQAGR